MKAGDRVVTTPAFSKLFAGGAVWRGVLLSSRTLEKRVVWRVRVDGVKPIQYIAEKLLKKEAKR